MAKVFEDLFMDIQADMVYACLDYASKNVDKVYIYASAEGRMIASHHFYKINGRVLQPHKINEVLLNQDVSSRRQDICLDVLSEDLEELIDLCKEHNRPMPTEIKMIYDVKKNSLDVRYKYDNQWLDHKTKTFQDVLDEWFEEIKNSK